MVYRNSLETKLKICKNLIIENYSKDIMLKSKIFYAEATRGYGLKVMTDVLSGCLKNTHLDISETGINIQDTDEKDDKPGTIMFNISLPRENFKSYKCDQPLSISINL